MRIAISAESFLPRINGVSNSVMRIVKHLESSGHEALVFAPGNGPTLVSQTNIVRIPAITFPSIAEVDISRAPVKTLAFHLAKFRPDVVHLASPFLLGDQMRKAAKALSIPTLAIFQTDVAGFANYYGLSPLGFFMDNWIRRIHSHVDLNLAPSSDSIDYLSRLGVSNVHHWGRGVDLEQFHPNKRSDGLRLLWGADDETLVIGYLGRLAPEKRIELLGKIPGDLVNRKVKIVIIGEGPSRAALELALPRAVFTGHMQGSDLGAAVASMDLMITPGENETFCQVIQEAMASGVPVLAPGIGGPRDLVYDGETGALYKPGDTEGLINAALNILNNGALRMQMGIAARAKVQHRTWSLVCDQLIAHYETLAPQYATFEREIA